MQLGDAASAVSRKGSSPHEMVAGSKDDTKSILEICCAIGIDFGRTKCEATVVVENGSAALIPLELGNPGSCFSLPSYVSMGVGNTSNGAGGWEVGQQAVTRAKAGHPYTVYDLTMLLGRKLDDLSPGDLARWPFTVRATIAGKAVIECPVKNGSPDLVYPEQIAAKLLSTIKQRAEGFTGKRVTGAVVCVPAAFNRTQRQAVRDACSIAGLHVERLIISSTASAVANAASFAATSDSSTFVSEKTVLVADCGGGSLDVSLVRMRVNRCAIGSSQGEVGIEVQVKATDGDFEVAGEALTNCLVEHFEREVEGSGSAPNPPSPSFSRQLRRGCTLAKKVLSTSLKAFIALPPCQSGLDSHISGGVLPGFASNISRAAFEDSCGAIWGRMLNPIERVLELGETTKESVDLILLIGGTMHVPNARKLVGDCFAAHQDRIVDLPDHTAAIGAALIAAQDGNRLLIHEATPLGLGIRSASGDSLVLVPPSTPIPTRQARLYYANCQGEVTFEVLEDQPPESNCRPGSNKSEHCLGRMIVDGSRASPLLILKLEIVFEVDAADHLAVSVADHSNGRTTVIPIAGDETCLSAEAITLAKAQLSQLADASVTATGSEASAPSFTVLNSPHNAEAGEDNPFDALRTCVAVLKPMVQANLLSVCITPGDLSVLSARVEYASTWLTQIDQSQQPDLDLDQQKRSAREYLSQIQVLRLSSVANSAFAQLRHVLGPMG